MEHWDDAAILDLPATSGSLHVIAWSELLDPSGKSAGTRKLGPPRILDGPAPCDDCQHRDRCAAELLACASFLTYLWGAHPALWRQRERIPTRALYFKAFDPE